MERFFQSARLNFGPLKQSQVDGINAILEGAKHLPITHVAYLLATSWLETGTKMQPVTENLNYSVEGLLKTFGRHRITEAQARHYGRTNNQPANQQVIANIIYGGEWGRKNLGNTLPNDGWDFRGRGLVQITGRTNYAKYDLLNRPDDANKLSVAVRMLVDGSEKGLYTGKKLSDFLPSDYVGARQVINGKDKASEIAGYARHFENALRAGGWSVIQPKEAQPSKGWLALLASIMSLFKRSV